MQKKEHTIKKTSFSERHPRINFIIGLTIVFATLAIVLAVIDFFIRFLGTRIIGGIDWLARTVPKLDAVIIVSLITGTVSILGVIINSIVGKIIEYRKERQEYLAKKREEPYADFIEMVYKVQQKNESYSEEDLKNDISRFSKGLTLWGSPRVVRKWVQFREQEFMVRRIQCEYGRT